MSRSTRTQRAAFVAASATVFACFLGLGACRGSSVDASAEATAASAEGSTAARPGDAGPGAAAPANSAATPSPEASSEPSISEDEVEQLRDYVVRSNSAAEPKPSLERSPEAFAKSMRGTFDCGKQACRAGREVCVFSPGAGRPPRCEAIREWVDHRTPMPKNGFPPMAGITGCAGSSNCPEGTVCCLHQIGMAEVQATVCHASLDECRDREEMCSEGVAGDCRQPGTRCDRYHCVPK